jgi:hypothetical protein
LYFLTKNTFLLVIFSNKSLISEKNNRYGGEIMKGSGVRTIIGLITSLCSIYLWGARSLPLTDMLVIIALALLVIYSEGSSRDNKTDAIVLSVPAGALRKAVTCP